MDNKNKVRKINIKLLVLFFIMLAVFGTLLTIRSQALFVSPQISSLKQTDRPNPTYLTYNDLINYYDILCCQHGTPLNGENRVHLTGSHSQGSFDYNMGNWQDLGYGPGSVLEQHSIYSSYSGAARDFDKATYTHRTYGYYQIVEQHIATPKEAYIIAEMKKELDIGQGNQTSAEVIYENGQPKVYEGTIDYDNYSFQLSTGETAYTIHHKYVVNTPDGAFYVDSARDSDGNIIYILADEHGGAAYTGRFERTDPKSGVVVQLQGYKAYDFYYYSDGNLVEANVPAEGWDVYLMDYDTVVDINGTLYYAYIENDYNYIQIAWWTTDMGTSHQTVSPSAPNNLSKEADAFEAYMKEITGISDVYQMQYEKQHFSFDEDDGTHSEGDVTAPVIDYHPGFNEDADQNGVINEADEVTPTFNYRKNTYLIGPYSLNYVKRSVKIDGRAEVDFAKITGVKLDTNVGELEFGTDWNFLFLADQTRDPNSTYPYPDPNEVFYIEIKYIPDFTTIKEFKFEFEYMNAGAELDIYDGIYNEVNWTVNGYENFDTYTDGEGRTRSVFSDGETWIECTSVVPHDSQTLAHALIGARWYEEAECVTRYKLHRAKILVEKRVIGDFDGSQTLIDDTYIFKIYIDRHDGEGLKEFQHLTVRTHNGFGRDLSHLIVWGENESAPDYYVEEIGGYNNNGPFSGTLRESVINGNTVTFENYVGPDVGLIRIQKRLINPTNDMWSTTYNFRVSVTGTFSYNNGPITTYTSRNPLIINGSVTGEGEWTSGLFRWYGSAPKYHVEEIIPNDAFYQLDSMVRRDAEVSSLRDGDTRHIDEIPPTVAWNRSSRWSQIEVDKRMVSSTTPQPGEVFKAHLTITGEFKYGSEYVSGSKEIDITLDSGNGWHWSSDIITWRNNQTAPRYTIYESYMADGTEFVSITDQLTSSRINNLSSRLQEGRKTKVVITNDEEKVLHGKLEIIKLTETEDLYGKTFSFKVNVTGTFGYNGGAKQTYTVDNPFVLDVQITPTGDRASRTWDSELFYWDSNVSAPRYTVEEVNLPAGSEFVSISNGSRTETSVKSISGVINGNYEGYAQTVITCINKGTARKNAHIVIIKESTDEVLDDYVFYFKVTISGTFRYYDKINPDGTKGYTQYTNTTLVLDGKVNDVEAVCGGEDWVSELITWEEGAPAPTYTVEEISIPANVEFVSISNRTRTSTSTKIDGTLAEGTDNNYITAINKPTENFHDGSLRIAKKTTEDLKGQIFNFNVKIKGEFDYAGKHYGAGSPNGDTLTIENVQVEGNGNPWVLGTVTWDEGSPAPTYEVTEVNLPAGSRFVSISNETQVVTDASQTITGTLNSTKSARVVAINYGAQPNGSHIEITKEVLNKDLKGRIFYFNVRVWSSSPFRYHDLEDATKVTTYNPGEEFVMKNVPVVADEKDWVSGYFEWDAGAAIPQYEITEVTGVFPDGVKSVSLRNDTSIIVEELTNASGRDLTITGSLAGDITHIIAVNDADSGVPVKGKITVEKQSLSDEINNDTFTFTVTVTGKFKYNGTEYRKLEIKDIKLKPGEVWTSNDIEWYESDGKPVYTVTEVTADFPEGAKFVSIRNAYQTNTQPAITGTVEENSENWVIVENTFDGYDKGRLQIHKVLLDDKGNEIDGVEFKFKVAVTLADGTVQEEIATVTSGGYWRSNWYTWSKKDSAPTYHIEEIDNSGYEVTFDKQDGQLEAQDTEDGKTGIVSVYAENHYITNHSGKLRVNKNLIVNDKISEDDVSVDFTFLVTIKGNFIYNGVAYTDNKPLTLKVVITKESGWTWESSDIKWNGDKAPTFAVEEPSADMPVGWDLVSTESSSDNNELVDGQTAVVDVTNEWRYNEELIVTMKLGGKVWDDTNRTSDKHVDALENGKIDEGEPGIENVKVTIYRALVDSSGQVVQRINGVYVYDENDLTTHLENYTYTDDNGNWSFGAVSVPALTEDEKAIYGDSYVVTYDVEFEYDGQTFEPTEFLATAGGQAQSYVGANATNNMYSDVSNRWSTIIDSSTSERDKFLLDSMAVDDLGERTSFNNKFADVQGVSPIDDSGNTVGKAAGVDELNYSSVDSVSFFNSDNSRKISTLETLDENKEILDQYKIKAATSNANLTFPFYTEDPAYDTTAWHLRGWDKTITDIFTIRYKFEAIYNYCLSINLGLVEREGTDVALEKDLTEALVVVNGKALKYKFNSAIDLEDPNNAELLYKQLAVADAQIEYNLGLYSGDYYYRASVYDGSDAGSALSGYYTRTLGLPLDTSELEIYLKYTINVYNQSETYDVTIGEVADYYDSTFELVNATEKRYVQTLNGKDVDQVIEVASPSTVKYLNGSTETGSGTMAWTNAGEIDGSDGVKYSKLTSSSLNGHKLAVGEKASITVTFKIGKDSVGESGVLNAIKLGKKHNVAEITKFTSYYSDKSENRWSSPGQISGRVDEDSAPDNVNIADYNDKPYYEDDTDSAPIITIGISDEQRIISGIVWDDAQTQNVQYGQVVGNGLFNPDEGDKVIDGITTEIYESITVPETDDNGEKVYKEYQFAWPTNQPIPALGNKTIEELTGFKQATVTQNGEYSFYNIPAGNYKVRFVYGDKQIETGKTGSEEVYSGQDYKTTAYQVKFDNDKDNDGFADNEWHDITNSELNDLRVNDARDDEARRLYISAKSEMLTFDNSTVLATADNKAADHTELFGNYETAKLTDPVRGEGYYMYAETAKINLGVENVSKVKNSENIGGVDVGVVNGKATQNGKDVGTAQFIYHVKNVDCGIEERSQTKLTLDKQIKEIILKTSDDRVILDAVYDIEYTLKSDGTIASTVVLNEEKSTASDHIASLNRRGAIDQGYRYLIIDESILQGAQIEAIYQLTVFNMSETDRISEPLETLWANVNKVSTDTEKLQLVNDAMSKVATNLYTDSKGRVFNDGTGFKSVGYGTYFGSVYYLGSQGVGVRGDEKIVQTKVHQMIDYVDPDVEFTNQNNNTKDHNWENTDVEYLMNNHLLDPATIQILDSDGRVTGKTAATDTLGAGESYSIISDKLQRYQSENKNNLILNLNSGENATENSNSGFVKFLDPYMADSNVNRSTGTISLTVTRFYSSETDASDIDNLAELIKVENTAGRRDARNIPGNVNPYKLDETTGEPVGVYAAATQGKEKDASATEVITLSPPTGLSPTESRTLQLVLVITISITIIAVSIVIIKKKVLNKN